MLRKELVTAVALALSASTAAAQDVEALLNTPAAEAGQQAAKQSREGGARRALQEYMDGERGRRPKGKGSGHSAIADPDMAAKWAEIRESMDLEAEDRLYFFVSFSMPDGLLRAYALDAAEAGGELVFRGIGEGMDINTFVQDYLLDVLRPGGMTAPVQIDPRLFDAYQVERVPTIVLARAPKHGICQEVTTRTGTLHGEEHDYDACAAEPEDRYWKLAGSVTTHHALERFQEAGAPSAASFIENLGTPGEPDEEGEDKADNRQAPIAEDDWEARARDLAERNAERLRERYADEDSRAVYNTPMGPAVGPPGQSTDHMTREFLEKQGVDLWSEDER